MPSEYSRVQKAFLSLSVENANMYILSGERLQVYVLYKGGS